MNEIFNSSDFWITVSAILSVVTAIRCIDRNSDSGKKRRSND